MQNCDYFYNTLYVIAPDTHMTPYSIHIWAGFHYHLIQLKFDQTYFMQNYTYFCQV